MGSSTSPDRDLFAGSYTPGNAVPSSVGKGTRRRIMAVTSAQTTTTAAYGNPATALSTTFATLYTCPAGSKAFVGYLNIFPQFSSNGASQQLIIGRSPAARATAPTYADVIWSSTVGNTAGNNVVNAPIVMQPGDVLWAMELNRASGASGGFGVFGSVAEVLDPNNQIAIVNANIGNTQTTLYTAPSTQHAHLLVALPEQWIGGNAYSLTNAASSIYPFMTTSAASGTLLAGSQLTMTPYATPAVGNANFPAAASLTLNPGDTFRAQFLGGGNGCNVACAFILE